jgi:pentatricopeptide repeat protein
MITEDDAMDKSEDVLKRCLELFHRGQVLQADRLAEARLGEFPDDGELWQLRGLLRQRLGDLDGACAALETASMLVPLESSARCALADCYARTGRIELARDLYRHLAGDGRCPTPLLPAVASGLGALGDHETALEVCQELSRRDSTRHEALFGMAFYMRRLGYPIETILPVVARAHELAPQLRLYRVLLGSLLAGVGRQEEAYDLLRGVAVESVRCCGCLRRMMAVFRLAGDEARYVACRKQAERVGDRNDSRSEGQGC